MILTLAPNSIRRQWMHASKEERKRIDLREKDQLAEAALMAAGNGMEVVRNLKF